MGNYKGTIDKPAEDIRVPVIDTNGLEIGGKVRLTRNLNRYTDENGETYYSKPAPGITRHMGITKLKKHLYNGAFVIVCEEIEEGQKRRNSWRKAQIVTTEEALDFIFFANRLDLLERERFLPLKILWEYGPEPIDRSNKVPDESKFQREE